MITYAELLVNLEELEGEIETNKEINKVDEKLQSVYEEDKEIRRNVEQITDAEYEEFLRFVLKKFSATNFDFQRRNPTGADVYQEFIFCKIPVPVRIKNGEFEEEAHVMGMEYSAQGGRELLLDRIERLAVAEEGDALRTSLQNAVTQTLGKTARELCEQKYQDFQRGNHYSWEHYLVGQNPEN